MVAKPTTITTCGVCGGILAGQAHVCPGPYHWRRLKRAQLEYALQVQMETYRAPGAQDRS